MEIEAQAEEMPAEALQAQPERFAGEQENETEGDGESEGEASRPRRRRRRRRGGRNFDRDGAPFVEPNAPQPSDAGLAVVAVIGGDIPHADVVEVFSDGETDEVEAEAFDAPESESGSETAEGGEARRRRRSRRGGRNRHREGRSEFSPAPETVPSGEWVPEFTPPSDSANEAAPKLTEAETFGEARAGARTAIETAPAGPSAAPILEPVPATAQDQDAASPDEPASSVSTGPKRTGWWQRAKASFGGG